MANFKSFVIQRDSYITLTNCKFGIISIESNWLDEDFLIHRNEDTTYSVITDLDGNILAEYPVSIFLSDWDNLNEKELIDLLNYILDTCYEY